MHAHILRKWSLINFFMYLLLAVGSFLTFWCSGASAMHLAPFNLKSLSPSPSSSSATSFFNDSVSTNTNSHHHDYQQHRSKEKENLGHAVKTLQRQWELRMREKRSRIQTHRKERILLQRILDQHSQQHPQENTHHQLSQLENLKQQIIDNNIVLHQKYNEENFSDKIKHHQSNNQQNKNLYEVLSELRANISLTSNRNRRESRFNSNQHNYQHHSSQYRMSSSSSSLPTHSTPSRTRGGRNGRGREKKGRYCSARDPRTLAYESPTVFEGKIKSMTTDRQSNFSATVEIIHVYKQQINFKLPKQVRLQFAYKNASECDIYREDFRHRGFVRDELEQGKIYFLFVKQIGLSNFTILGQPIRKISRTAKDVEIGVSEKYGKNASIDMLYHNFTKEPAKEGKRVKITCRVNGEPAPKVTWFKDGRSINRNKTKFEFVHTRRRSDLIIKSAVASDSGRYECRAKNRLIKKPVSKFVSKFITLTVTSSSNDRTIHTKEGRVNECPPRYEGYCLNGGTCWIVEVFEEVSCNCIEGFTGERCIDKTTNITPSTYPKQQEFPFQKHPQLTHKLKSHKIGTKIIEQSILTSRD